MAHPESPKPEEYIRNIRIFSQIRDLIGKDRASREQETKEFFAMLAPRAKEAVQVLSLFNEKWDVGTNEEGLWHLREMAMLNFEYNDADYVDINNPDLSLEVAIGYRSIVRDGYAMPGGIMGFGEAPKWLQFPAVLIGISSWGEITVSTPYGSLPNHVIAPDGRLYGFMNTYFFSYLGQGVKYEGVFCKSYPEETTREALERWGFEYEIPRVDLEISKSASRHVALTLFDFLFIEDCLKRLETGEFK